MDFQTGIFFIIVIIFSAIIHEYSHGWMANQLGDPTAKYAGRLTLNPIPHLDIFGSVILPLLLFLTTSLVFAYAKPVPFNPYNLRNQRWGPAMVAVAGPLSNLFLAFVFGLAVQFIPAGPMTPFLGIIVYANVLLCIFNLVPIPPLDGSKVLYAVLPDSLNNFKMTLERYGFILLIVFIFAFSHVIRPIISFFFTLFTGGIVHI